MSDKPFTVRFPDRSKWKDGFQLDRKGQIIWYTDGSKTNKGCMVMAQGGSLASLWAIHNIIPGISVCYLRHGTIENLHRNYRNRNIYILSDNQAAIKALDNYQINSKLVWYCHQSLMQPAKHNRVQPIWVPGHEGITGNETVNQLAKLGSKCPFIRA
jgi:ribonuclease HI